ncbi:MAG: SGNH/GDSL hydrolase family protein [Pseudomonadales bacterium]|nr:SGNH/GDSL hydrolase family protein [Pseudomonadales bacterium]
MLRLTLQWTLCLLLFPLLIWQGIRTRANTPRLPVAPGPRSGPGDSNADLHLLMLGDSVAVGVGLPDTAATVAARTADHLTRLSRQSVSWQIEGENGDRLADLQERVQWLRPRKTDAVVISIGVNDVSHLTSVLKWQLGLTQLMSTLRDRTRAPVFFIGIPPMHRFTALPQPLRYVLGVRARMLDHALRQAARLIPWVTWIDISADFHEDHLAEDGYHPDSFASDILGQHLATAIHRYLRAGGVSG